MTRILKLWVDWFVLWVIVSSAAAYLAPGLFTGLKSLIMPGLGIIMFGMGMTLQPADFRRVARQPRAVACGVLGQFLIMPLVAFGLAEVFRLPPDLAMGFIILGCCPGGTASNVVAYLAKADVALSVTMTACSTLLAIVLTPWLVGFLGGMFLEHVDRWGLFLSVVKIVLAPVTAGALVRYWLKDKAQGFLAVFPAISVLFIALIIACVVALTKATLANALGVAGVLVVLHNSLGLALGYGLATAFRLPVQARRTVAIEVGMQNSGLGVALASAHFASPLVALPSTMFSVVHNLTGSVLANWWRGRGPSRETTAEESPSAEDA